MKSRQVLLSTTGTLDGWDVVDYLTPVSAQFVIGTGLFADFFSSWTDFFGTHSRSYEKKLEMIHKKALAMVTEKARALGANGVVGLRVDHDEISGSGKSMLMVTASGTAVRISRRAGSVEGPEKSKYDRAVSASDVQVQIHRQELNDWAQEGRVAWSDADWEFILENQVLEVIPAYIAGTDTFLAKDPIGDYKEKWKARFLEMFSTFPPESTVPQLYLALGRHGTLAEWILEVLAQINGFDAGAIRDGITGSNPTARTRVVSAVRADKPSYSSTDRTELLELAALIEESYPIAATITSRGMIGSKSQWICLCEKTVPESNDRCSCGRDRRGFEAGYLHPETAAKMLRSRARAVGQLFDGEGNASS